jgi:hypothetical protein
MEGPVRTHGQYLLLFLPAVTGLQQKHDLVTVTDRDYVCRSCASSDLEKLDAKLKLRLPQLNARMSNSIDLAPELLVCLECGSAQFYLSATELQRLKAWTP